MNKLILLFLCLLLLPSCSFKSGEEKSAAIETPTLVLENAKYTLGQEGEKPVIIDAKKISIWELTNKALLEEITFTQTDDKGSVTLSGKADSADINIKTKYSIFNGNVEIEEKTNNYYIKSSKIVYDIEKEHLETEEAITVTFPDGEVKGKGLDADLKTNIFVIGEIEKGELIN